MAEGLLLRSGQNARHHACGTSLRDNGRPVHLLKLSLHANVVILVHVASEYTSNQIVAAPSFSSAGSPLTSYMTLATSYNSALRGICH